MFQRFQQSFTTRLSKTNTWQKPTKLSWKPIAGLTLGISSIGYATHQYQKPNISPNFDFSLTTLSQQTHWYRPKQLSFQFPNLTHNILASTSDSTVDSTSHEQTNILSNYLDNIDKHKLQQQLQQQHNQQQHDHIQPQQSSSSSSSSQQQSTTSTSSNQHPLLTEHYLQQFQQQHPISYAIHEKRLRKKRDIDDDTNTEDESMPLLIDYDHSPQSHQRKSILHTSIQLPALNRIDSKYLDMTSFLILSGIGLLCVRVLLYPMNVIKTRLQTTTPVPSPTPMLNALSEQPISSTVKKLRTIDVLKNIIQHEGMKPLFAGLGLSLILTASRQLYFYMYENLRGFMVSFNEEHQFIQNQAYFTPIKDSLAAFVATALYQIISNPLDIIVQRLMTHNRAVATVEQVNQATQQEAQAHLASNPTSTTLHTTIEHQVENTISKELQATNAAANAKHIADAFDPFAVPEAPKPKSALLQKLSDRVDAIRLTRNLYYADPTVFYRGFVSSTVLWSLNSCIWWGSFEMLLQSLTSFFPKSTYENSQQVHIFDQFLSDDSKYLLHSHPWFAQHFAAGLSSFLSVVLTHPLDLSRTKLMVHCKRNDGLTATRAIMNTIRESGWSGLWCGLGARTLFIVPTSVLTMSVYQLSKVFSVERRIRRGDILDAHSTQDTDGDQLQQFDEDARSEYRTKTSDGCMAKATQSNLQLQILYHNMSTKGLDQFTFKKNSSLLPTHFIYRSPSISMNQYHHHDIINIPPTEYTHPNRFDLSSFTLPSTYSITPPQLVTIDQSVPTSSLTTTTSSQSTPSTIPHISSPSTKKQHNYQYYPQQPQQQQQQHIDHQQQHHYPQQHHHHHHRTIDDLSQEEVATLWIQVGEVVNKLEHLGYDVVLQLVKPEDQQNDEDDNDADDHHEHTQLLNDQISTSTPQSEHI